MNRKIFFFISLLLFSISLLRAQEIIKKGSAFYLSNTLVVKVKENISALPKALNKSLPGFSIQETTQLFPAQSKLNKGEEALSRIYLLKYDSAEDPLEFASKISKQPGIEWAEPKYIHTVTFSPNDSLYVLNQQKNLQRVLADSAWNITKGDSRIIIGIVDTGVDWTHPDLLANVWYDHGLFVGKDFGGENGIPDNDPREDNSPFNRYHGTHVAGIACAVTNNKTGIASIGFNCSFIPIKVSRGDQRDANGYPYVWYGYEGIKYAADKKAWVINCSWGGFDYSHFAQEVINYAVSKGALVVAAAGNNGELTNYYPASYKGVLSVGWLETDNDSISIAANYGRTVDVFAPGTSILSTWQRTGNLPNQLYNSISGSSMSAPLVSGLAGLIFSTFRSYTALQLAEQIRVTADSIEQSNKSDLKYLLGRGRINAYRAVSDTNTVSVRATDVKFVDEGNRNGLLESGETVSIEITFTNYLKPVTNISVQLVNTDNSVEFLNRNLETGAMGTLDSVKNISNKFQFVVQPNAPLNHDLNLLLKFTGTGYSDFQWISARINPTYDTHNVGKITMSITSKGALGFNDYPNNLEGSGFRFNGGDNLLFEGAFMYGTSSNTLMDAARIFAKQSEDFVTSTPMKVISDGSEQDGYTVFYDKGGLGIEARLSTYTYTQLPDDKYIILKTRLNNTTAQNISNFYAGYFFDWDLPAEAPLTDSTYYDETDNFGVAFDKNRGVNTYVGAALVSSNNYGYYPIDNNATTGEIILADANGFSDSEKWITISNQLKKKSAGPSDISFVVSAGPFIIPANQSIDVGFSIAAGSTINELKNAIKQSRIKYPDVRTDIKEEQKSVPTEFSLFQNYPNPFNPETKIKYSIPVVETRRGESLQLVKLRVYDVLGREVATLVSELQQPGQYVKTFHAASLPSGVYFYKLSVGNNIQTKKMILLK
ncbi:MAG: S8 family peptidase [Melioribacteraceae bacterium]